VELGSRPTHIFGFCPFAASTMYQTLEPMKCDGHFLDIPMDASLDQDNRALIASNPTLFGSYFRPRIDVSPTRLQGVDEFSSLVEPVALAALKLAREVGGMLEVYDRWSAWIERRNIAEGLSQYRRFYGTPLLFCEFVVEQLRALGPADDPILQFAEVVRTSFDVATRWSSLPRPTTMATHRSIDTPDVQPSIHLNDRVRLNSICATMRLDYDVVPLLDAPPDLAPEPERKPTYLMWDLSGERHIRLARIDPFLYLAIERLKAAPHQPVASLLLEWVGTHGDAALEYERLMNVLAEARTMHILETV
jgi:hypothetical protein